MLTHLKFGSILLCTGLLLQSCYPVSISSHASYASSNAKDVPANAHILRNNIPVRAMRQILKRFPAADAINWQKSETGWTAGFTTGTINTSINFNSNGDWDRIYNLYSGAPEDIRNMVAKKYGDYSISSVYSTISYMDEKRVNYSIVIRKNNNCKVLELCDGNLSVFTELDYNP